jgi:hypothetical protein
VLLKRSIPDYFAKIPTLEIIEIHKCNSSIAESANAILQEQQLWEMTDIQVIIAPEVTRKSTVLLHSM